MATDKKITGFPDVENKLQAPTKKSLFERQKAEAEAKRQREEAETKAVYEDFIKSFDEDSGAGRGSGGAPRRHYTGGQGLGAPTGPAGGKGFGIEKGRVPVGPGSLGLTFQSVSREKPYESVGFQPRDRERNNDKCRVSLAFDNYDVDDRAPKRLLGMDDNENEGRISDREEERAVAKPTLRLASLPPGTSPAVIKALLPSNLKVDGVKILPSVGSGVQQGRKSMLAIVTLAKETAANDIDAAVNALQKRYLGYGYYLDLHRHLSSAVISNSTSVLSLGTTLTSHPFGAKAVDVAAATRGHAPPPHQGRFAPPTSYAPTGPGQLSRTGPLLHVSVQAPRDIKELKLIHKVLESLLIHGPEFEALLMSRPDVQREEKWAWLWDPRSTGGVWYRWRLWEILTGTQTRRGQGKYLPLFEGSSAWKQPDQPLPYEYTTRLDEFISDSEYHSSDEDDSGDEGARRQHQGNGNFPDASIITDDGKAYLNPLEKAKLTHLLARLPTTTGTLRKGDVARVTAFAISHAGRGADEIVQMIVSNVEKPFAYTSANTDRKKDKDKESSNEDEDDFDTSAASLIGLFLISDILSSSSTSGVRHAWRYRQLFETTLKQRHIFEKLGRMERRMNWGRLRAEKWRRSVENILALWEGWCVFPQSTQESFASIFDKPPLTAKEEQEKTKKENDGSLADKGKSKWKAVEVEVKLSEDADDVDGQSMEEDLDGEIMDDDVDGEPMVDDEEDMAGVPMGDGEARDQDFTGTQNIADVTEPKDVKVHATPASQSRMKRPRAVDMFAGSDDDED